MDRIEEYKKIKELFKGDLKLSLDKSDEPKRAVYEDLIYWLSRIYRIADWSKIARSKNVYSTDVFQHAVKSASYGQNIRRVNDKICEKLGIQSIPIASRVLDNLEKERAIALTTLKYESIYLALKAMEISKINIMEMENNNDI